MDIYLRVFPTPLLGSLILHQQHYTLATSGEFAENLTHLKTMIMTLFYFYFYLFKQCLKRMTQLAINNYSTLWSSN